VSSPAPRPGQRVRHHDHGPGVILAVRRGGRILVVRFEGAPLSHEVAARDVEPLVSGAAPAPTAVSRAPSRAPTDGEGAPVAGTKASRAPAAGPAARTEPPPAASGASGSKDPATPRRRPPSRRSGAEPAATAEAAEITGVHLEADAEAAARTLEAMRLGVVPAVHLDAYTVGREAELATVDRDLAEAIATGGAVRAFLGDYGTGKTHLLELIEGRARAANMLCARVTLDPTEVPPSHPKRVYRALVQGLRYPDIPGDECLGLAPLLDRALGSAAARGAIGVGAGAARADEAHLYLSAALSAWGLIRELADTPSASPAQVARWRIPEDAAHLSRDAYLERCQRDLLDWLEGHPTVHTSDLNRRLYALPERLPRLYSLKDYRPWARIYGYLLSGIATLARAVGYAGLCVLLDEAEFYALLSGDDRRYARTLFKALTFAALGDRAEAEGELPFDAEELAMGGQGIQKRLPPRFGAAPGLYVAFAMTPAPEGREAIDGALPEGRIHDLSPLVDSDYQELCRRVAAFYVRANASTGLTSAHVDAFGQVTAALVRLGVVDSPRPAMKLLLELLDLMRHRPDQMPRVVRQLRDSLLF